MTRWMKVTMVAAVCAGIAGCDARNSNADSESADTRGADVRPADPAKTSAAPQTPTDAAPAETMAKPAAPASPAAEDQNLTQDTAEGAAKLFLRAMKHGDFEAVVMVTDPGSPAFESLNDMASAFSPETANPKVPKDQLEMIRSLLSSPWKQTSIRLASESEGRVEYHVLFGADPAGQTRNMVVNEFQGVWRVIATDDLLRPPPPAAAPTMPPPPADSQE